TTALGPVCVATAAKTADRWDVEVIDENNYKRYGPRTGEGLTDHRTLQKMRPADVVGLYGGLTSTVPRLYEIAKEYKAMGVTTVAGGQHFAGDNIAEALSSGVDIVVIGEGEEVIKELLALIAAGGDKSAVPGIAFLKDGNVVVTSARAPITDFDSAPLPDFSLVRYAKIKVYPINWVRGCGMNCEFCTVKGKPRPATPERVFRQITDLVEKHHARRFFLVDDLFGQFRSEAISLCKLLAEYQDAVGIRLEITVQIRLDKAKDTELLTAMRRAGIATVCIGFESPIEEQLKAMEKHLRPEDMVALARIYSKAGFFVHGMFIFGYPLAPGVEFRMPLDEQVKRFKKFIKQARLDTVQVLLPVPFAGTELTERLRKENRLFPLDVIGWEYYDGNFPVFEPDQPNTPEQLHVAGKKIMGRFYSFKYMFDVGFRTLLFPYMVFYLHNIRKGWQKWHKPWWNSVIRFGGWVTIRRWTNEFKKGGFLNKLKLAEQRIRSG
ncbi:MAG: radical SAM protein, partial [bacterium]